MADVASSRGTSSRSNTNAGPDMPDGLILSPSVKEAMDRILPHSASQLLQHRLSFEDINLQNGRISYDIRENGDKKDTMSSRQLSLEEDLEMKCGAKKRISRADLEIITSRDVGGTSCNERTSRRFPLEKQNDCPSKMHSDSDDVSRPFAAIREKKKEKRKRRKKQTKASSQELQNSHTSIGDLEDDFGSLERKGIQQVSQTEKSNTSSEFPLSDIDIVPKVSNTLCTNVSDNQNVTQNNLSPSSQGGSANNSGVKEFERHQTCSAIDDMSNNSFSSIKENMENKKRLECQKLPRPKLSFYNVVKHKNKIKKTFPPCYIVIEQISALLRHADSKSLNLALLCKDKKEEPEDDFEVSRGGRSLRKRDKTICYVEPTEADIFLEFKRKRPRNRAKEDALENEDEAKRRKLNAQTEESEVPQNCSSNSINDKSLPKDCEKAKLNNSKNENSHVHDYAKAKPPLNNGPQEVVVYPKGPIKDSANKNFKSKPVEIRAAPVCLSTSSATAVRSLLTSQPSSGLISTFSPFLTSMPTTPGVLGATTLPSNPVIPTVAASGMVRPQFCMVKMDGKDVLLQVLPPSSPGAATQGSTLLLPGGKRLVVPHNHHLSQQINQAPRIMNSPLSAMPMPLISAMPSGLAVSNTPSISSAATHCAPFSVPSISTPQSYSIRGIPRTSLLPNTRTVTPVTVYPPTSTLSSATSSPLTTALQRAQAPVAMAAPNSTTVVRNIRVPASNLRATVPNQPGSVRAVRIFVPGCQATGVPGRFATLGSVASNSSALTRLTASSDLLPQRQQTKDTLTPEQRAEKRRKLERKYPLPPGVVIKTEPLDSPSQSQSTSTYSRSLLPGNIQVVSASRRPNVTGVQSIRFLNPASAAAALGSSATMPLTNLIVRAASADGRQAIIIPSSLSMVTSNASLRGLTTTAQSISSTTLISSASAGSGGTISILPAFTSALSNSSTSNSTSSSVTSCDRLLSTGNAVNSQPRDSDPTVSSSLGANSSSPPPSLQRNAATTQSTATVMIKLKTEVEAVSKLLVAQEALGLRGDRIDKLKELLKKKEDSLKVLLAQPDCQTQNPSANNITDNNKSNPPTQPAAGQSEAEPIVIEID
ncbi:hypothetical protein RRG08_046874 [Elysia crispata]|uniref:Uncharacterized protein n=1 Tax=Elysia crispata TaxID=231223 RepID=A0AAE1DGF9_9GAST|nr:hypothetical protein RRG08_046874 [Elysia crispata]